MKSNGTIQDYATMDLSQLQDLYEVEMNALNQRLLNGENWGEVQDMKNNLIALAKLIKKRSAPGDPAESLR
ncbi:MAG: hypothetical protein ACM3VS_16245 [Candidatus Dadabacteria bacterium]